jgi:hypothetical protein
MDERAAAVQPVWANEGEEIQLEAKSQVAASDWESEAWDSAWTESNAFLKGLSNQGVPRSEVGASRRIISAGKKEFETAIADFWASQPYKYLQSPDDIQYEADQLLESSKRSVLARLRNWWSGRGVVVEVRQLIDVRIPLFVLAAPTSPGSSAEYESTTENEGQLAWSVKLLGTGIAKSATVTSSVSSTLGADSGQTCLIFLPVLVAAEKVRIVDGSGQPLGHGTRLDLSPSIERTPVPSGFLLAPHAVPPPGPFLESYPLDGYAGPPATYKYIYSQEESLSFDVGLGAFDVGLRLTGASTMTGSVAITFKLSGGTNYRLHRTANADGVVWK